MSTTKVDVRWNGEAIRTAALKASAAGVNATMEAAAKDAQRNTGGWRRRSGRTGRSIRVLTKAFPHAATLIGYWGSKERHAAALFGRYKTLTAAAERVYPSLGRRIRVAFEKLAPRW